MPILSGYTGQRDYELASIVATELWTKKLLWYSWPHRSWFAREHVDEPWTSRRGFALIRDHLVLTELEKLEKLEPYSSWPEMPGLLNGTGTRYYGLLHRIKRIWKDWAPPQDLPTL